jgi:hypothetical protein
MHISHNLDRGEGVTLKHAPTLKQKVADELRKFWAIAIYLLVVFGAFTTYKRLVLSEAGISYYHYGFAVIESVILAKVIMIGEALRLGRRFESPPLIIPVLAKSVVFGLFFAVFTVLEHTIDGLLHHQGWADIAHSIVAAGRTEILARTIMVITTFVPFFAFLETDRALGGGRLFTWFFRKEAIA